jgi:fatty acid desaturase
MQFESFIPIVLFICILLAIKSVVEARTRRQMVQSNGSEEMLRALIESEETRRRQASLRWGVILLALAVGFGLIEALSWQEPSPGLFAILLAAAGLGNLAAYYLSRHAK